ncbi:MAG: hypothetical protein ACRC8W_21210 [Plesiomonas shigelloides]
MQKGQMVKCVSTDVWYLTVGKTYPVLAVGGDEDTCLCGTVNRGDFLTTADNGETIYCCYDRECAHAEWELVDA